MKPNVNKKLSAFLGLTESIEKRLQAGEMDAAIALLKERGEMLQILQSEQFVTGLKSTLQQNCDATIQTRNVIKRIIHIDQLNMKEIKQKIQETSGMISELANGQDAVRKLRSVSHVRPKQIVDFLY